MSCSAVLPALCHLQHKMEVTDDDPAYVLRFKTTFSEDLNKWKENLNITWLKVCQTSELLSCEERSNNFNVGYLYLLHMGN